MRGKGAVALRFLALVAVAVIAAGCTAEVRRLQGANQELVRQRDALSKQIADLEARLAAVDQQQADADARVAKAQDDVDYWKQQAQAFKEAYEKRSSLQEGISEKVMRELAAALGGDYLPGGGIRLASDILFESGKADLKAPAKAALERAAGVFQSQEARSLYLRVDGHTDNVPIKFSKWKDNMELSQARARAVWVEIKNFGVAPERTYTAGFGEYRPIADNSSTVGKAANRRVEIWVVPPPASASDASALASTGEAAEPMD